MRHSASHCTTAAPDVPVARRRATRPADRFIPVVLAVLIAAALPACSSTDDRLRDAQVRPMDRPECQVGSQRRDLDAGVPVLIGGTGCRGNPSAPQPLNRRPAEPGS
ncbi:hypothetical protein [Stenotrophomonas rhizophila]|uniref:hypothetical protein n=1 Tax=Stenotrophomonas rhizophila TaxID=216778 RepID=UPI0021B1BED2|nr:hypothetical protein [Stenotrophomonas rhizophila]